MPHKEIVLSVKRGRFRCDDPSSEESDVKFREVRTSILKRDQYKCKYCDLRSKKFHEAHHIDDDHSNNDPENLDTACALCHACFHVGFSGQKGRGIIIYLDPELGVSQADLNGIVRTLWIGERSKDQNIKMLSINMLARLYKQSVPADRKLGSSDPVILGDFLLQLSDSDYNARKEFLKGFYLLPLKEGFPRQIKYWEESVYSAVPSGKWLDVSTDKATQWASDLLGDSSNEAVFEVLESHTK